MAAGTIVAAYKDANSAYASVLVAEGGATGNVEYNVATPLLKADGSAKTTAELKTDLTAAVTTKRNAQLAVAAAVAISGAVTV
jgi:hypothetical protein